MLSLSLSLSLCHTHTYIFCITPKNFNHNQLFLKSNFNFKIPNSFDYYCSTMPTTILDQLTYLSSESIITIMRPKFIRKGHLWIFNATLDQEKLPKV